MDDGGWVGVRVEKKKKTFKSPSRLFKEALAAAGVRAGVRLCAAGDVRNWLEKKVCAGVSLDGGRWAEVPLAWRRAWKDNFVKKQLYSL